MQGGFDPLADSRLTDWLDYRTLAAVGDMNPIDSWTGRKGMLTAVQSGTARPTKLADDGDGRASVSFNGVNNWIRGDLTYGTIFGSTGDMEVWSVARFNSTQGYSSVGLFDSYGSTSSNVIFAVVSSTDLALAMTTSSFVLPTVALWDNAWKVIRMMKTGARRVIQVNGTTIYDATTSAGSYDPADTGYLRLGSWQALYAMTGAQRHWMAFDAPLDDATAAKLNSYLQTA